MPISGLEELCTCPPDSRIQTLVKISNNLDLLFSAMAEDYVGQVVSLIGPDQCGCSEVQILAAINANLIEFGRTYTGGGGGSGNMELVAAPASSSSSGTVGQFAEDDNYFYVCVATNTWTRTPISDWS